MLHRALHLAALVGVLAPASCTSGDGGAVVVRWKLIDQIEGTAPSPCVVRERDDPATCCVNVGGQDVTIDTVRVRVVTVGGDGGAEVPCASCCAPCSDLEQTTDPEVPPGTYLVSIEALRCGVPVGYTPPGVVRTVRAGEVTNLSAVEILIPGGAASAETCGDGGVSAACAPP